MNISVFGTGIVGKTIASKLITLGHTVMMGSRTSENQEAVKWANENGGNAKHGTFTVAAEFGGIVFNCTKGEFSLAVLKSVGEKILSGKILIDVANPLDFSKGMPPTLSVCNDNSLGEQIQKAYPGTFVVKTLNTMNCGVMVDPSKVKGKHDVFVSGNEVEAKTKVIGLLQSFGWVSPIDLGDITTARGTEMILPLWIRLWGVLKTGDFNFSIARND